MHHRPLAAAAVLLTAATFSRAHPNHAPSDDLARADAMRRDVAGLVERAGAHPDDPHILLLLGQARLDLARATTDHADFAKAERAFRRVLELDPASSRAPYGLAYALLGAHRFQEALTFAREAAHHDPDEPRVVALIADVHLALGNSTEALALARSLAESDLTPETLSRVALAHQALGNLDEAVHSMGEALEAGGLLGAPAATLAWCRSMLGDFALEAADTDRAMAEWRAAVILDEGCHHAHWRLAQIGLREGLAPDEAVPMLQRLTERVAKPVYLATLADGLDAAGRPEEARSARSRAEAAMRAEIGAEGLGHLREFAEFLLARSEPGDAELALEFALRDVNEVRQDAGAFDTAAWALYRNGRVVEALKMSEAGLLRNPSQPQLMARGGIIAAAAGRHTEGRRLMAAALQKRAALEPLLAEEARRALDATPASAFPTQAGAAAGTP